MRVKAPAGDDVPPEPADWFSTRGRRGRGTFLLNFLFVNFGVAAIAAVAEGGGELPRLAAVASGLVGAWVNICLIAQRLHDVGRSGWLQLVPFALGLAGVAMAGLDQPVAHAMGLAMILAGWVGFTLWLVSVPGSPGANGFGSRATMPRR